MVHESIKTGVIGVGHLGKFHVQQLLAQLAVGGRMVIPVGIDTQHLQLVVHTLGGFESEIVDEVRFVPLRPGLVR